MNDFLQKIPAILSSKTSIAIYLFLLLYLVVFAILGELIPALKPYEPSDTVQLILGNYTNVISALGASIAAGTGVAIHNHVQTLHKRHDLLEKSVEELHEKLDELGRKMALSDKGQPAQNEKENSDT